MGRIKTTVRHHFAPSRMVIIKKRIIKLLAMVWRKMEILYYWWECKNVKWYSCCAKKLGSSSKVKPRVTI